MFQYISLPIFFASFIVGLIAIFIFGPETKTVEIYPSLDNYKKLLYRDNAQHCFKMTPHEVDCPADPNAIQDVPIQ
jgi:hypothetical protein